MSIADIIQRAELLTAQIAAQQGAVDSPLAPIFEVLGLKIRPGMHVLDTVTGEIVEVVSGGIVQINPDSYGT